MSDTLQARSSVDIAVIGGGPTGMFAAFYAGMRQATVAVIESMPQLGGQLAALYPEKMIYDVAGFPEVKAQELVDRLKKQMDLFHPLVFLEEQALNIVKHDERKFEIITDRGVHWAKAVIITGGIGAFTPRKLTLPGADRFEQANLHYFVKDPSRFRNKRVVIAGGGDSAVDWALLLEKIASSVTIVHRRDQFRAMEHSIELLRQSQVRLMTPMEISGLHGTDRLTGVTLRHMQTDATTEIELDELIVSYGFVSSLGPIRNWGIRIENGSIVVDSRMETNIPGIFAAGDITTYPGKLKLIAVGFGEAPTAVNNCKVYIDPNAKLSPGHSSNMNLRQRQDSK
jgi:thioredoxin reductase (NADPH)